MTRRPAVPRHAEASRGVYLAADREALAWAAFVILVAVALLGFIMFARWVPVYRTAVPPPRETSRPRPNAPCRFPWSPPTASWAPRRWCWCCWRRSEGE
ncbi:hypothetical protein ABZV31_11815 [Streptomyces sp. NPDC005202]|uniref:hypothetical protein n=1 Tax=Streptomyces sp. NPDC005202 TaxID=3157021 RepID=UPI0033B198A0